MKRTNHIRTRLWAILIVCGLAGISAVAAIAGEAEIPALNAGIGNCSVAFTVRDPGNNPLYNAKIRADLRYGLMGLRHLSLEVSTNSDGKAKITGLPASPRKEFEFRIISGNFYKETTIFPSSKCEEDKIDITFGPQDLLKTN